MEDKNKKMNYQPSIEYVEDYYANYNDLRTDKSVSIDLNKDKPSSNNDIITDNIQNNINNLIALIPLLPEQLQTVVNQVFKPVFNEWYSNLKDKEYPDYIPKDKTIITTPGGDPYYPSGTTPGGDPYYPPGITKPKPYEPIPIDPYDPDGTEPSDPWVPYPYDPKKPDPIIYTPEPDDPVIPQLMPEGPGGVSPGEDDDDALFKPSSPFVISYPTIDKIDVIKKEYIKNMYDLYNYYTDRLQGVIGRFAQGLFIAYMGVESDAQLAFINGQITMSDIEGIDKDLKHIIDACLRSEIIGANKISFCENMFSLESSLYHCKNFKSCYELRLRYAEIEKQKNSDKPSSDANTILRGMEKIYDKKYDIAYINLYKYLNSSTQVLEDSLNTLIDGLMSKNTLIKKGGYNK